MSASERIMNRIIKHTYLSTMIAFAILSFSLLVGIELFTKLSSRALIELTPFDTDEADHANPSLELATAIKRLDLAKSFSAITKQAFYPPVHSIFVACSYLMSDITLASSRIPTVLIYLFSAVLLFLLVKYELQINFKDLRYAISIASFALLLILSSPITIEHSVLCMLELTGIFAIIVLTYYLASSTKNKQVSIKQLVIAATLGFTIFLTKYSFGIISLPALVLAIFLSNHYWRDFRTNFRNSFVLGLLLLGMLAIWLLLTEINSFIHFFKGHKSYAPLLSKENLLFEINAWYNSYCITSFIAIATIFLATLGGLAKWNSLGVRFSVLNVAFALIVLGLSTTNEERHFMVAIPSMFFLAAIGTAQLGMQLNSYIPNWPIIKYLPVLVLTLFIVNPIITRSGEIDTALTKQFEGAPQYYDLMQFISNNTSDSEAILVNGVSDDFGIETLRWFIARKKNKLYSEVNVDAYPYRADKYKTNRLRMRNIDRPWLNPSFPKKPLTEIIAKGYYNYGVQIKNLVRQQKFKTEAEEFSQIANKNESKTREMLDRRVTIVKF